MYPSVDVVKICTYVERLIRHPIMHNKLTSYNIGKIKVQSLGASCNAFINSINHSYTSDEPGINHLIILIKNIIDMFIKIRMNRVAKEINEKKSEKCIRKKFTKLILFNNE